MQVWAKIFHNRVSVKLEGVDLNNVFLRSTTPLQREQEATVGIRLVGT